MDAFFCRCPRPRAGDGGSIGAAAIGDRVLGGAVATREVGGDAICRGKESGGVGNASPLSS